MIRSARFVAIAEEIIRLQQDRPRRRTRSLPTVAGADTAQPEPSLSVTAPSSLRDAPEESVDAAPVAGSVDGQADRAATQSSIAQPDTASTGSATCAVTEPTDNAAAGASIEGAVCVVSPAHEEPVGSDSSERGVGDLRPGICGTES